MGYCEITEIPPGPWENQVDVTYECTGSFCKAFGAGPPVTTLFNQFTTTVSCPTTIPTGRTFNNAFISAQQIAWDYMKTMQQESYQDLGNGWVRKLHKYEIYPEPCTPGLILPCAACSGTTAHDIYHYNGFSLSICSYWPSGDQYKRYGTFRVLWHSTYRVLYTDIYTR